MIKLHHLENSRSTRILWLLEELNLDYELITYKRTAKTLRAPKSAQSLHPLGRFPIVEVDGRILVESGAIITYMVAREGKCKPTDEEDQLQYTYWLHYAEGSAMTPMIVKLITTGMKNTKLPFFIKPIVKSIAKKIDQSFTDGEIQTHFGWIEKFLSEHQYFAGDHFSAADIQMSYPIQASFVRSDVFPNRPFTQAWLDRVQSRSAYQQALIKGGAPIMSKVPHS